MNVLDRLQTTIDKWHKECEELNSKYNEIKSENKKLLELKSKQDKKIELLEEKIIEKEREVAKIMSQVESLLA